jgi:hypothetical protein
MVRFLSRAKPLIFFLKQQLGNAESTFIHAYIYKWLYIPTHIATYKSKGPLK